MLLEPFFLLLFAFEMAERSEITVVGIELPFGIIGNGFLQGTGRASAAYSHAALCFATLLYGQEAQQHKKFYATHK